MSSKWLIFDVGNSRAKWALFRAGDALASGVLGGAEGEASLPPPDTVDAIGFALAGAAQLEARVRALCADRFAAVDPVEVHTEARFGSLHNSYRDPRTMGVDRWLALIGAWGAGGEACCTIDVGTALTVDVVGPDGRHRGGWIVPGTALMHRSLALETARVGAHPAADRTVDREQAASPPMSAGPLASNARPRAAVPVAGVSDQPHQEGLGIEDPWGRSTGDCVSAGCAAALRATVLDGACRFLGEFPAGRLFLTGGGAPLVAPALRELAPSVTIDPLLVLRGLARRLHS